MSETSYWINFFIDSGIPPSDSAHYAVIFTDNRIDKTMFLDLNKEYLNDVGITRLGDVIAILKHAKEVHKKTVEESVLNTRNKSATTGYSSHTQLGLGVARRDSPVSRIVNHCLNDRRSTSPANLTVTRPVRGITARLGPEKTSAVTVRSRRNIILPEPVSGNDSLSHHHGDEDGNKKSVFNRLGDQQAVVPEKTIPQSGSSDSVFSRLGGRKRSGDNVNVASNSTVNDDTKAPPLKYAGVLLTPSKKPKTSPPKLAAVLVSASQAASATEGILGDNANIPKRLKDRLGKVVTAADTTDLSSDDLLSRSNLKTGSSQTLGMNLRSETGLGEVTSSSDEQVTTKPSILSRLGKQH